MLQKQKSQSRRSYRGYGPSQGTPSEHGLKLDAAAALEHLSTRTDCDAGRVVVYGRSLGGAVALALASAQPHKVRSCHCCWSKPSIAHNRCVR